MSHFDLKWISDISSVAGNVPVSLIFQNLLKVIGSRKVKQREESPRTHAGQYCLKELNAAFLATPLQITTWVITTELQASGGEAY